MAGKKVYFAPGTLDKTNGAGRRVPTPRFLKHGRDAPTSEDEQYRTPQVSKSEPGLNRGSKNVQICFGFEPYVKFSRLEEEECSPKRYTRRPRRSSISSNSSVGSRGSQRGSLRTQKSPARRTPLRTLTGKIDGRGSPKERERKSLQAGLMNRTPDGKFARSKSSLRASTRSTGEHSTPGGSSGGNEVYLHEYMETLAFEEGLSAYIKYRKGGGSRLDFEKKISRVRRSGRR